MPETVKPDLIYFGKSDHDVEMMLKYGNRHGLIAGATGTGKTVSLQVLAEGFSRRGVPVFLADVKGDLAGISQVGGGNSKLEDRAKLIGLSDYTYEAFPVEFWDLFGEQGHPVRTTISEIGPLLLSRLMNLNDVQEGVLNLAFKLADDNGLLLLDLKDLQAMMGFVSDKADELRRDYGNVTSMTVGTIQRELLTLEQQGANKFCGEPALQLQDFIKIAPDGRGVINILTADKLIANPRAYSTMLLWLLSELFEELPEAGDLDKPKLVFFFDEAHLLFNDAPSALIQKVEQVVRLIRSKGVGVFFVTQNPSDIPDAVLAQLGNRVQHALRAYTPKEQKSVRAAAESFRVNPAFDTEKAIMELAVGEAVVSFLEQSAVPMVVQRTMVRPPSSHLGAIAPEQKQQALAQTLIGSKYDQTVDRESAYERLRAQEVAEAAPPPAAQQPDFHIDYERPPVRNEPEPPRERREPARRTDSIFESMTKSLVRSASSSLGRSLVRGILGSLTRRR